METSYNTAAIRDLLKSAFDDQELTELCYDHFPAVHEKISDGTSRSKKIQYLIDFCKRRKQFEDLLAHVQHINPDQYHDFINQIRGTPPPNDNQLAVTSTPLPHESEQQAQFDVFLSYNELDKAWVSQLKDDLWRYGVTVWLDRDEIRPGDLSGKAREQALDDCRAVALIISCQALDSGWIEEEYYRSLAPTKRSVQTIPVILGEAELPGFLQSRNAVDFYSESSYARSVWELVWGITGKKPDQIL